MRQKEHWRRERELSRPRWNVILSWFFRLALMTSGMWNQWENFSLLLQQKMFWKPTLSARYFHAVLAWMSWESRVSVVTVVWNGLTSSVLRWKRHQLYIDIAGVVVLCVHRICRETKQCKIAQIENRKRSTIMPLLCQCVDKRSTFVTDFAKVYNNCEDYGFKAHKSVCHKRYFVSPMTETYARTI